jgi:N-dimethylarginine dimethylaminohydrolase
MQIMNQGTASTLKINIPSETATLKKVIMCFASPLSIYSLRYGGIDAAFLYQLRYNKFAYYYSDKRVCQQQALFMEILKANGVEVLLANQVPHCGTQHYTRDIAFAIDDTLFIANPRRYYRQREIEGLRDLLPRFSKVAHLESGVIEGGDVIVDDQFIIVGLGEETNKEGINCLRRKFSELGIEREIVTIEFTHRGIIHLDTKFNIPAKGVALIHPKSFKPESLKWLESHFDLIEATDNETANMEINTFALSPRKVVMLERSHRLASLLESKGIEPILIDYSEVTKLPGSFRCTTLPIERAASSAG